MAVFWLLLKCEVKRLWQRASSQSPCGVRMSIKCYPQNPRRLRRGVVRLTIRKSREDALKSTELSRDSSRCKARHRNMPGFTGFSCKKNKQNHVLLAASQGRLALAGCLAEPRVLLLSLFIFLFLRPVFSHSGLSCKQHCHLP